MNEFFVLAITMMSGSILGVFYFGGLWLTLRHLPGSQQPALLALSGFLVRSLVCLFVFYLISSNGWVGTVSCLAGFTLAKLAMTDRLGRREYEEAG
jgi:F1F0 ATPase subunit 2